MAEATTEVSQNENKVFYCHQCSKEISPKLPEFLCPTCDSGFIEEITDGGNLSPGGVAPPDHPLSNPFLQFFGEREEDDAFSDSEDELAAAANPAADFSPFHRTRISVRTMGPGGGAMTAEGSQAFQGLLETLLMGITGAQRGGGGFPFPHGQVGMFSLPRGNVILAGNPGDYAWGEGGLDAIITQLMNQLEGTGPPPASKEKIENLPTVNISKEHVEKNLQCSVCFEDYKKDEQVRSLPCQHMFHTDCIVPWLELHGTCPVCRKNLDGEDTTCDENSQSIPQTLESMGLNPVSMDTESGAQGAQATTNGSASSATGTNLPAQQPGRTMWSRSLGNSQPSNQAEDPSTQLDDTQAPRDSFNEYE